jgi:hypothetical protein
MAMLTKYKKITIVAIKINKKIEIDTSNNKNKPK